MQINSSHRSRRPLTYEEVYPCPVCHYGELAGITLMDAFGCGFCRHIFTADLPTQSLQIADNSQPFLWKWDGQRWRSQHYHEPGLGSLLWMVGGLMVIFPTALVGLAAYVFPPLPGDRLAWFPYAWMGVVLVSHGAIVAWLAGEYYQFPLYNALRIQAQRLWRRD